jgi:hypothetical protein
VLNQLGAWHIKKKLELGNVYASESGSYVAASESGQQAEPYGATHCGRRRFRAGAIASSEVMRARELP